MSELVELNIEELKESQRITGEKVDSLNEKILYKLKETDPNFNKWVEGKLPQFNYILD
ncbi:hypothetical protein [Niallia taxi]|uniref:hypothetical protein n=1 Tax=Niallia taxi TaxID=2499688 RepID=UPI0015F6538C|nr:hypothetical protein [Niallia taxi]